MALKAVLVDRARVVEKLAAAERVEGTTPMEPVNGQWFKARLFLPAPEVQSGAQGSYKRSLKHPQLMYATKDIDGDVIALRPDMKVEVDSGLDVGVYKLIQEPEQIRKKARSSVIAHIVNLERVTEFQFEPVV